MSRLSQKKADLSSAEEPDVWEDKEDKEDAGILGNTPAMVGQIVNTELFGKLRIINTSDRSLLEVENDNGIRLKIGKDAFKKLIGSLISEPKLPTCPTGAQVVEKTQDH